MTEPRNAIAFSDTSMLGEDSFEIARLWVTNAGGSTAWIAADVLTDPQAFGRLLADAARHAAQAYTSGARTQAEAFTQVLQGLAAALAPNGVAIDIPNFEERS